MNLSNIKFSFIKNVNDLLNNLAIEKRTINITYFHIDIECEDFELHCDINENKNKILTKRSNYEVIIGIAGLLMMITQYFDFIIQELNKMTSVKGGDKNEV